MSHVPHLISLNDVCAMTSMSRTWVNRLRDEGKFPKAVPLGDKRVAFIRSEVIEWINQRIAERDGRPA